MADHLAPFVGFGRDELAEVGGRSSSRVTFIFQIFGVTFTMICMRALFYSWLQHAIVLDKIEARRVALIGDISHCSMFANRLKTSGIKTIGVFNLPKLHSMKGLTIRKIVAECRSLQVDNIIVLANNKFMRCV